MKRSVWGALYKILKLNRRQTFIVMAALVLSVAVMVTQQLFTQMLNRTLDDRAAALLTADLEVASNRALTKSELARVKAGVPAESRTAERRIFSSMMRMGAANSVLIEVVSMSDAYPLIGECTAIDAAGRKRSMTDVLADQPNGVVVAKRLIDKQGLNIGDQVAIGGFSASVLGVIHEEPDLSIEALSLGPRVYMILENADQTGFNPSLSREYRSFFVDVASSIDVTKVVDYLEAELGIASSRKNMRGSYGPSQPVMVRVPQDVNNTINRQLGVVTQFFLYVSLLTLILSSAAFACMMWTSLVQQLPAIGDLRYLGLSVRQLAGFLIGKMSVVALAVVGLGWCLGIVLTWGVSQAIQELIVIQWSWRDMMNLKVVYVNVFSLVQIVGITIGLFWVFNFQNRVSHFEVERSGRSQWVTALSVGGLLGIGWVGFLLLNGVSLFKSGLLVSLFAVIAGVLVLIDTMMSILWRYAYRLKWGLSFRLAMMYLSRSHTIRRISFICMALAVTVVLTIAHYQRSLAVELDPGAQMKSIPSLFVIDLMKRQVSQLDWIDVPMDLSPMIRARMSHINQLPIAEYEKTRDIRQSFYLYREQRLSIRDHVYDSEELIKGAWFNTEDDVAECSIEARFAKRLKLDLGDQLTFDILGVPLTVTISSIRQVDWTTFKPNFFMIIEPGYLEKAPQTWIGAIFTSDDEITTVIQDRLSAQFPNVSILNIKQISQKVGEVLNTFLLSIRLGGWFCLGIGLMLFMLLIQLFMTIRMGTFSMLRWIGASHYQVRQVMWIESAIFVGMAYVTGCGISIGLSMFLFDRFVPILLVLDVWTMLGVLGVMILSVLGVLLGSKINDLSR